MRCNPTFALAAWIMFAGSAYAEKGYVIRDLGTFGGTSASAPAINDRGQVVVNVNFTESFSWVYTRAFIVDGDRTSILPIGFSASGITSRGDVVGRFDWQYRVPAIFQNHAMTGLSIAGWPYITTTSVPATNDKGQVVGSRVLSDSYGRPSQTERPVLWQNGQGAMLAPSLMDSLFPGAPAYATAINDSGLIVGYGLGQNSTPVGFYGANNVFVTLNADPEHPGKTPTAVNNRGTITGHTGVSSSCEPKRGFVVERGVYRLLPMTGTVQPRAISDSGVIAGTISQSSTCNPTVAFVLDGTALTMLPQLPGGSQSGALAMNKSGDVAGYAYGPSGGSHAVVWTKH